MASATNSNDTLLGVDGVNDTIDGLAGNDSISGLGGDDTLVGGLGNDTILGGNGDDRLDSGAGSDSVYGGLGADRIRYYLASDFAGDYIDAGLEVGTLDRLQLRTVSSGQTYDLSKATVKYIDRIDVGTDVVGMKILINNAAASTADANQDGVSGDIAVVFRDSNYDDGPAMVHGVYVDASGLASMSSLRFEGYGYDVNGAHYAGFNGDDTVMGGAGADNIHGGLGSDSIIGNAGDDTIYGGLGTDSIYGGAGADRIRCYSPSELAGDYIDGGREVGTTDRLQFWATIPNQVFSLSRAVVRNIDRIDVGADTSGTKIYINNATAATADINQDGILGDIKVAYRDMNYWNGPAMTNGVYVDATSLSSSSSLRFEGDGYDDAGGHYAGFDGADTVKGGAGSDNLNGGAGDDLLDSQAGADTLLGGAGDDTLVGGAGGDSLVGGMGDDVFCYFAAVDLAGDSLDGVVAGSEADTIRLAPNSAHQSFNFAMATINNVAEINICADMVGTSVILSSQMMTTANSSNAPDSDTNNVIGVLEINCRVHDAFDNEINAENGVYIDGSMLNSSQSLLVYGSGEIEEDDFGNIVRVCAMDGNDTVKGGGGRDWILCGGGNDSVVAGAGDDFISGGANYPEYMTSHAGFFADEDTDTLIGGAGNDVYFALGDDIVAEIAGEGYDVVYTDNATATYANVEKVLRFAVITAVGDDEAVSAVNLIGTADMDVVNGGEFNDTLAGQGGADIFFADSGNDSVLGGDGDDWMLGQSGNDFLDGGTGADTMEGGVGNDTYVVNVAGDKVVEKFGAGTDTVRSGVSYTLGANVENLILLGISNINGSGNAANNNLTGNAGTNTLAGGFGNDTVAGWAGHDSLSGGDGLDILYGGAGNDTLNGGAGVDKFVFNTALSSGNVDVLMDFMHGADQIVFDQTIFVGLNISGVTAAQFSQGAGLSAAEDIDDRIIYDTTTGALYYDADGTGVGNAAVQFARLTGTSTVSTLSVSDFLVIA